MNTEIENIRCAAILYKSFPSPVHTVTNREGVVLCGFRHPDIIGQFSELKGRTAEQDYEQGFLTSKNRFVGREEAAEIAFNAQQIKEKKSRLFSEDIY